MGVDIPIVITNNHIENKAEPGTWNVWWEIVSQGNDPSKVNPEGYNLRSIEQIEGLDK